MSSRLRASWSIMKVARPTGESDKRRQRLRPRPHEEGVVDVLVEGRQLLVGMLFLRGKTGRHRRAGKRRSIDRGRNDTGHVGVDAEQSLRRLHTHQVDDDRAPVAALRHVARVTEALHQHIPRTRDALGTPARRGRLAGEAVARHRRNHDVEGVGCGATMRGRIGERLDDLELFDDRAGPSVRDDHGQGVLVLRANVHEVDVQPIDLGDELRLRVQPRLDLAPVIFGRPVAREFLNRRRRHALREIRDRFLFGPSRCVDPLAQLRQFGFRNVYLKRAK